MVEAFIDVILTSESQDHHDNRLAIQNISVKDVVNQVSSFEELGIPFMEVEGNLTGLYMNYEIVWAVRAVRQIGDQQFRETEDKTRTFEDSIQNDSFHTQLPHCLTEAISPALYEIRFGSSSELSYVRQ